MLYISTRSKIDSFTAYRALHENCAPDGGAFAPMQLRKFGSDEIELLLRSSFNDAVSTILNYFFSTKLSGFDLDFSIGRMPAIRPAKPQFVTPTVITAPCQYFND